MKKRLLLIGLGLLVLPTVQVNAASSYISANNSVVNGNKVTATVTLRDTAAWNIKITGSGATNGCSTREVGDTGTGKNDTRTFSVTCTATKLGTINFNYSGDITDQDGTNKNVSGSKSVTVVKPREKSTNNNLKDLSVNGYNLTPSFSKDKLEYTVNVESNVEKITINANKEDGYASVSGTGEKDVVEGDNKFEIKVTSETGSTKTYTINVIVKDSNPIIKTINGKNYTVIKRGSVLIKPESFTDTKITISDTEIPAFYNEKLNLTLIGLKDESGVIYLYKYNAETDSLEKYSSITSKTQTIIFENTTEEKKDYTKTKLTINEQEYEVLQSNINKDYVLIYGTNIEDNTKNWYLYNIKENSIQLYFEEIITNTNNNFNKNIEEYRLVILVLTGLSILLLAVIIVLLIVKNKQLKLNNNSKKIITEKKSNSIDKEKN